ncbi:MAG: hypothetical protein KatS3mg033_0060 [Thermonema sp.]|uniref:hypothetical protein n=1 Tax=Thermonema sp. TaxID=2231181 RepID=UPI0021DC475D|nr:hypothetical protein [Thermonema sp.]GIV38260.1 MAG: hypothetical protein KatS3mg033_0060 [Thermonema sp.]
MQQNKEDRQPLHKRQQKAARRLVRVSQFLFVGLLAINILYRLFIPTLKRAISEWIYYQSEGVYSLEIENVFIDWQDGSLLLKNIVLQTDSSRWQAAVQTYRTQPVVQSQLALLRIEDIDWWHYWHHDSLFIRKISIRNGQLHWQQQGSRSSGERKLNYYRITRAFLESVQAVTPSLRIGEVEIDSLSLWLKIDYENGSQSHRLGSLSSNIYDIVVEKNTLHSPRRPFFARYATFWLHRYQIRSSKSYMQLAALHIDTRHPDLYILSPSLQWTKGKLQAERLHVKGIQWTALFFDRRLHLHYILLQAPRLQLNGKLAGNTSFLSQKENWKRRLPALTGQWFDEVRIDSLHLSDGNIQLPKGSVEGIYLQANAFSPTDNTKPFFCEDIQLFVKKVQLQNKRTQLKDIQLHTLRQHLSIGQIAHRGTGQSLYLHNVRLTPDFQTYWNDSRLPIGYLGAREANIEAQSNGNTSKAFSWQAWFRQLSIQRLHVNKGDLLLGFPSSHAQLTIQDYSLRLRTLQFPRKDSLPAWQALGQCVEDFHARRLQFQSDSLQWGMQNLHILSDTMGIEARKLYLASPALAASLPVLYVPGLRWSALWKEKRLHIDTLHLSGLELYLSPALAAKDNDSTHFLPPGQRLAQWIQKSQWRLLIHHLHVSVPVLYWLPSASFPLEGEIKELLIQADSLSAQDSLDVLHNSFLSRHFYIKTKQGLFSFQNQTKLRFDSLTIDKQKAAVQLHRFSRQTPSQRLRMVQGRLHGIAWDSLWQQGRLHAHSLAFIRPQIELKGKQQVQAAPTLSLRLLHLDTVLVSNADVLWQDGQIQYRMQHANLLVGAIDGRYPLLDSLHFLRSTARSFFRLSPHDTLSFAHMQWDAKGSGLRLRDLQWRAPYAHVYFPYLYVQRIDLPALLHGDSLLVSRIQVGNVSASIEKDNWAEPVQPADSTRAFPFAYLQIDSLQVKNSRLQLEMMSRQGITRHSVRGIDAYIQRFTHTKGQTDISNDFSLAVKHYEIDFPDPLYHLDFRHIHLQASQPAVQVGEISVFSTVNVDDLWKQRLYTKTILQARIEALRIPRLPWAALLNGKEVYIPHLQVKKWELAATDDLRLAKNPLRRPPMPHELLQRSPGTWLIDTVVFETGTITYEQKQWNNVGSGKIGFHDARLQMYHLGDRPDSLPLRLEMASLFMKQGVLAINMEMARHGPVLQASYAGTLGQMSAIYLNRMLEPTAQVRLQTGIIKKITFKGSIEDRHHRGQMLAIYRNFKVSVLDTQAKRKRRIVSKLANLLIRNTNRRKTGTIQYERLPSDGFLRILWQGLASGLRDTLLPEILKERGN